MLRWFVPTLILLLAAATPAGAVMRISCSTIATRVAARFSLRLTIRRSGIGGSSFVPSAYGAPSGQ